jgi:hypothetical protein
MPPSHVWSKGGPVVTVNITNPHPSLLAFAARGGECLLVVPCHFTLSLLHSRTLYTPHKQSLMAVVGVLVDVGVMGLVQGVIWAVVCLSFSPLPPLPPVVSLLPLPPHLLTLSLSRSTSILPASSPPLHFISLPTSSSSALFHP